MTIIQIQDDFDLDKIIQSGQCFRPVKLEGNIYRFLHQNHLLYICPLSPDSSVKPDEAVSSAASFQISCSSDTWKNLWAPYFDLSCNYASIRASIPGHQTYLARAAEAGAGIRVLRQDPWEMLVTFIISQRKNIPAIRACVEILAKKYGEPLSQYSPHTSFSTIRSAQALYSFPTAEVLSSLSEEDLRSCKLGYRAPYILDAARKVSSGQLSLEDLHTLSDAELLEVLRTVHGIGEKVASCIALFAYHRTALAPVDVWIRRVIDNQFAGENPFPSFGGHAGIIQQYVFYYSQNQKQF